MAGDELISLREAITAANTNLTFGDAPAGDGGGIWNGNTLNIINGTFTGNESVWYQGGGVWNDGTAAIIDSAFSGNSSYDDGGGIWNGAALDITNGTFLSNSAARHGGGIHISGNSAGGLGGAIDNWGGTVESTNSTIVMNRADADGNGPGTGGGIYNYNASSVTLLNNTLLAGFENLDVFLSGKKLRELLADLLAAGVIQASD